MTETFLNTFHFFLVLFKILNVLFSSSTVCNVLSNKIWPASSQSIKLKTESCSNCRQSADACDKKEENKVKISENQVQDKSQNRKKWIWEGNFNLVPGQKKPTNQITLQSSSWTQICKCEFRFKSTGKSLSEALIFASIM